jgi:hypothetical protein
MLLIFVAYALCPNALPFGGKEGTTRLTQDAKDIDVREQMKWKANVETRLASLEAALQGMQYSKSGASLLRGNAISSAAASEASGAPALVSVALASATVTSCTKYTTTGWHEGTLQHIYRELNADGSIAWEDCAQKCTGFESDPSVPEVARGRTCERWTLKLSTNQCMMMTGKGIYHDDGGHVEGDKMPNCRAGGFGGATLSTASTASTAASKPWQPPVDWASTQAAASAAAARSAVQRITHPHNDGSNSSSSTDHPLVYVYDDLPVQYATLLACDTAKGEELIKKYESNNNHRYRFGKSEQPCWTNKNCCLYPMDTCFGQPW